MAPASHLRAALANPGLAGYTGGHARAADKPVKEPPLLLEVEDLRALSDSGQLLLVEVGSARGYHEGHIPGALHLPPSALLRGTPPAPGRLPDAERLGRVFSGLGLTPERHVVAYDDEGGGWAGRLLWTLEVLGHPRYSYLNGGIRAWRGAGAALATAPGRPVASDYKARVKRRAIAEIGDILPRLGDPELRIWDARSAEEYRGERSGSARAGRIPGAIHLDWLELIDTGNHSRLVDLRLLLRRLRGLGLGRDREVIAYCQSHHRSSLAWLAMRILGYRRARGYHGSWGEWGNREDTPIETG